jgi:glycosyltransferase involved in cell wall biosynthesis
MSKLNKSSAPTRICFPFVGSTIGGSHLSTILLIENLDRNRFEPVVVLHEKGLLSDYLEKRGISYSLLPLENYVGVKAGIINNVIVLAQILFFMVHFLWKNRIDVVHTQDVRMHYSWAVPARLAGCKFIWHQRSIFIRTGLTKVMIYFSHRVFCISEYVLSSYPYRVNGKFKVIYNPFSVKQLNLSRDEYKKNLHEQLGVSPECSIVGFCGNLVDQKRPVFFVKIAGEIISRHPKPVVFVMVGSDRNGMSGRVLATLNELKIQDRVFLLGFVTPIEPMLAGFDVLVAPGFRDGFGRTLVESIVVGTPVVAADSGGHSEIMHNCPLGFLAAVDDLDDFTKCVIDILNNTDSMDVVRKESLDKINQFYSKDKHVENIMKLYDDCIK